MYPLRYGYRGGGWARDSREGGGTEEQVKRKLYIGTNTKMFQTGSEAEEYITRMDRLIDDIRDRLEFFFIPSFTSIERCAAAVGSRIRVGAQNMAWEDRGQFTGEVSPLSLEEIGARFVLIGHSERRHVFGETDDMEAKKIRCAADHGFTSLLCVGETAQEKDAGMAEETVKRQLRIAAGVLSQAEALDKLWIGYEPVWAIGTSGVPAGPDYAEHMHSVIKGELKEMFGDGAGDIPVLYGGSVNPGNANDMIARQGVDGLFVGRSAWDPERFSSLIRGALEVFDRRMGQ